MTARELIAASLRLIGVLASGETPEAQEQADALSSLNRMLGAWSTEGLLIPNRVREEFALVSGQGSRTIGTGGNFNTTRPIEIEVASIEDNTSSPGTEYPLEILTLAQWAAIGQKDLTSSLPTKMYYEPTYPLGTIYLWPVPTATHNIVLYSKKELTSIASANTSISFPPGYEDALVNNLAVKLCPEYGKTASRELVQDAQESKANIMRGNTKSFLLQCDAALVGGSTFNIYTGP